MIARHIRIPDGGPVPDMVHFHKVGFQLNFCIKGRVDVLYEDQRGLRRIGPGDCLIQPPQIRHRVMLTSDGTEVIETGVPADHVTGIDHEMTLPTPLLHPVREWQGQRLVHNLGAQGVLEPHRLAGYVARDTTIAAATNGVAGVLVVRKATEEPLLSCHAADIPFGFVMSGSMVLEGEGKAFHALSPGDAFVIPPGMATRWSPVLRDSKHPLPGGDHGSGPPPPGP